MARSSTVVIYDVAIFKTKLMVRVMVINATFNNI